MDSATTSRLPAGRTVFLWLALVLIPGLRAWSAQPLPATPAKPVSFTWGTNQTTDPYAWLEADPSQDPSVGAWVRSQEDFARAQINASPLRQYIGTRIATWSQQAARRFRQFQWTRDKAFVLVSDTYLGPSKLVSFPSHEIHSNRVDAAVIILSPQTVDPTGLTDIRWYTVSPDATTVAALLVRYGETQSSLHFWDIASGRKLPDVVPGVSAPGRSGSAAWTLDSKEILYSAYGLRDAGSARVLRHKLGEPVTTDAVELERDLDPGSDLAIQRSALGNQFALSACRPELEERIHWVRSRNGRWTVLAAAADRVEKVAFGRSPMYVESPNDDSLYLLSRAAAPHGRILRVSASNPKLGPKTEAVVVELTDVIADFCPSSSGFFLSMLKGGRATLLFYDRFEKEPLKTIDEVPVPTSGQVCELVVTRGDEALYRVETFLEASEWRGYDPNRAADKMYYAPLADTAPEEFADVRVDRIGVKSSDGTRIPLFVIHRKGMRPNGEAPTLLTGYGAMGVNRMPDFDWSRRLWLDQGGVVAVAQLRGGMEMGTEWREAGRGARKQSVIEDLSACARVLVQSNYTRANRLAMVAEGHGGATAAAFTAMHPERLQALVLVDPVCDLLRAGALPGGARVMPEYGAPEQASSWPALMQNSPYALAETARSYPAVLIQSSPDAFPVSPAHSRKMSARWQASTTATRPILYSPGDRLPTNLEERNKQWVDRLADRFTFLVEQLGVTYSLVERGPWSGAVTPTSVQVRAKLVEPGMTARLLVSETPMLSNPRSVGPERSEDQRHRLVAFGVEELKPDTQYHYALEINGRVDWATRGQFRTFPVGPASFVMAFASCAKTGSANESFDRIREHHPLFFMNMGDFHYLNIATNSVERFRSGYDLVLASVPQSSLYREVPFVYMWDDHDYGGNNSNKKSSSHEAARKAYSEYVPHYPLAAGSGGDQPIYQSFVVGRVKFILTDLRSERDDVKKKDDENKSMMGSRQKEWFKKELLEANGKYPVICWMSSVPWIGEVTNNIYGFVKADQYGYIQHTNSPTWGSKTNHAKASSDQDHWSVFSTERREIADFVKTNSIRGLCILHGDSHMLAADSGQFADYATGGGAPIPTFCAAPLDQTPSLKGGPYSEGVYKVKHDEGCFGLLEITDRGPTVEVHFSGRNNQDKEKITYRFTVPAANAVSSK